MDFLEPELVDTVGGRFLPGTSSIIDELYDAGAIPSGQSVWVRWAYGVKLTYRRALTRASWLLVRSIGEQNASLARIKEVFSVGSNENDPGEVIFLRFLKFPSSVLVQDAERGVGNPKGALFESKRAAQWKLSHMRT
eukprot:5449011-Pleurochrysis_carterae.AAC.1